MKRKRFPPNQFSLDDCFKCIRNACSPNTLRTICWSSPYVLHDDLGLWIRNNCGLWAYGTDLVVADIVIAYHAKKYQIPSLNDNTYVHPDIPFDLAHAHPHGGTVNRELSHPDNCSAIIIEILIDILKNEYDFTNKN